MENWPSEPSKRVFRRGGTDRSFVPLAFRRNRTPEQEQISHWKHICSTGTRAAEHGRLVPLFRVWRGSKRPPHRNRTRNGTRNGPEQRQRNSTRAPAKRPPLIEGK